MGNTPISSVMTFPMKFLFPLVWGSGWCYGTVQLFRDPPGISWQGGGVPPVWAKWVFAGCLVLGAVILGRAGAPLKRITIEQGHLVISNYLRQVVVPLRSISAVGLSTRWTVNDTPVGIIELRDPTDFGQRVTFYPRDESAYQELREAVLAAGGQLEGDSDSPSDESAA